MKPFITYVVASLFDDKFQVFTQILQTWPTNFTWSYAEMPSLNTDLVVHYLAIKVDANSIKQKLREIHPQIALLVKA